MKKYKSEIKKTAFTVLKCLPIAVEIFVFALANKTAKPTKESLIFYVLNLFLIAVTAAFLFAKTGKCRAASRTLFAIAPAASFLLLESMIRNPFDIKFKIILLNMAILYIVSALLLFACGRTSVPVFFVALYGFVAGTAEHFVLIFRDAPLFPWDLKSLGTAASVVDNYSFDIPYSMAASMCALVLIMTLAFVFDSKLCFRKTEKSRGFKMQTRKYDRKYNAIVRTVASLLLLVMLVGVVYYVNLDRSYTDFGMYPYLFTPKVVYSRNGFTVAFLSMLRYVNVSKPDGYSDELLEEIKQEYSEVADDKNAQIDQVSVKNPDIIVIMNEAFSDLSVLTDFEMNEDYMPFLRSLSENTIKGKLHVSVLGGNTANTEFEFLTGSSMAFLPTGSIPYQQYIKGETPSLAAQLANAGYDTMAIHPYNTKGWNRNTVYPYFGFEKAVFKADMKSKYSICRQYVTDLSCYRYFLSDIKQSASPDKPKFVFCVTMQNHGSYTTKYDNFNYQAITATGLETDIKLSTYLSLIKKSDDAMEYLTEKLSASSRPTIVCFFGDHQPAATVSNKLLKKYSVTIDDENISELEQRYIVPFYIWANYDIKEAEYEAISANYLSTLLLETAGIRLTDSQAFLSELFKTYPVITANAVIDSDGNVYSYDEKRDDELILKYAAVQYSCLFDGDKSGLFKYKY